MAADPSDNAVITKQSLKRYHEDDRQHDRNVRDLLLTPPGEHDQSEIPQSNSHALSRSRAHEDIYGQLFCASVELKIWGVAARGLRLRSPPTVFPEYTKPGEDAYVYRDFQFWTSGFFPGSLYLLLERRRKYENILSTTVQSTPKLNTLQLEFACRYWTDTLHQNAHLTNTHDLGFMIMPWAKVAYELNHDLRALETIKTSANSLFSRFDRRIGCIRSWNKCITKKYNFYDMDSDFMVIIDNMMNLDLLFYAASKTGNKDMFTAALEHARTTARTHIRADGSTTHLVVFNTQDSEIKHRLTNQGYSHDSCWARGQSWAIAGFAETYTWTRDTEFLGVACQCADYFMSRLSAPGIVPWDFDAPVAEDASQPPDVSAAMVAAYGMLLIHQALTALGRSSQYLQDALTIIRSACIHHINPPASLVARDEVVETVECGKTVQTSLDVDMGKGDTILKGATINNYEFAPRKWADHGLVYADYFFLLVGNKLLEMGIGPANMDNFAA
ncbi:glycoside hydrolase family 88 protein [Didymella exigua CBS 183.55]|uniref:Glycoside hydrolase family 88 protein n=1 Tax=Didymella exigua CBS 183.55 TaxID=1150837 RepID=A0A6A5RPX9_9PLEO|nr:glycoside hydrolase family 88 protein [Didymella exigua CBS 183.55]KAF1929218.1 glycoside hydrolase family 88 protein [Didymella exigua CBS 183.55]